MNFFRIAKYRFRALTRKLRLDRELEDEMRFHIEMVAREYEGEGLSPKMAMRQAKIDFGGMEKMKETVRDTRGISLVENLLRDLRLAVRQCLNSPGFTLIAMLTLGLGIGICAAMFSVVDAVLMKPLPFEKPENLVWVQSNRSEGLSAQTHRVDNYLELRDENEVFESMGAYFAFFDYGSYMLTDDAVGDSTRLRGVGISEGFLDTLGVRPYLGRGFKTEELVWNGPPVAILNHELWKSRFGSNTEIIGKTIMLDGRPTEVIAVMPASFDFDSVFAPGTEVDMLVPFPLVEETNRWGNTLSLVGRLKEGVSAEAAEANLRVISDRIKERVGEGGNRFYHKVNIDVLNDRIRGPYRTAFYVLLGAVFCVLAIACVNLANLLIARSNARTKEFAMRAAIGAKRGQLIRQTLVESTLLAGFGLMIGVPLAYVLVDWFSSLRTFDIPLLETVSIDGKSIVFVILITSLVGIACGLLPALQLSGVSPSDALGEGVQRGSGTKRSAWLRKTLVVTEVALSCQLLIGAGLLVSSFESLLNVDLGFEASNAVAWRIDGGVDFESRVLETEYYEELSRTLEAVPGIDAVGYTDTLPLGRNRQWVIRSKGEEGQRGENSGAFPRMVSSGYMDAMGLRLKAGRFFNKFDTRDSQLGVVVNEVLANRLWKDRDPVGQAFVSGSREGIVIGVVQDVKHSSLDAAPSPEMYLSSSQVYDYSAREMVVRSGMPEELLISTVRMAIRGYSESIPSEDYRSLGSIVAKSVAPKELVANTLSWFSLIALALAGIGLYGVIAFSVGQRSREIGIRIAIGARPFEVIRMVLREAVGIAGIGVALGLVGAFAFSRLLESMLYEVSATDPVVFAFNALIVLVIAFGASLIPAWRASKENPVAVLRLD